MNYTSAFKRTINSLKKDGIGGTFSKVLPLLADVTFDLRYGLDTCRAAFLDDLTIDGSNKESGYPYKATRVLPLRRMFETIQPMVPAGSVFVDLGCGKGRAMLIACEFDFESVRGVEFARELAEIACENVVKFKKGTGTSIDLRVVESDVCSYKISPEENVFFVANSFDDRILNCVVSNIAASLQFRPRKVFIVYYNPHHEQVIEQQRQFTKVTRLTFYDDRFTIYTN